MNELELDRYSRQLLLANFDVQGQLALGEANILIIGLGGLGNIAATYLATAGIGHLQLADDDKIEASNLPRQVLFDEAQIGDYKAQAAAQQIAKKSPAAKVTVLTERLAGEALANCVANADVVLDCCDNFATRQQINRACFKLKKPLVSAAAIRWEGQLISFRFDQQQSPCYECLYPELSDRQLSCNESGIIGPVVGSLGVLQALEGLKIASGCGQVEHGLLKLFDGFAGRWRELRLTQDTQCVVCGSRHSSNVSD